MKEIGGYLELDNYHMPMLHEGAVALNSGRHCLAYLIEAKGIKSLLMPRFICDAVIETAQRYGVDIRYYSIDYDLEPVDDLDLEDGEWLYLVNIYGQFNNDYYENMVSRYKRVIVDQTHSYFSEPIQEADCLCTCRKYFGVSDGAFLYTDVKLSRELPIDESYDRMRFVLGRYERSAGEFFRDAVNNNSFFEGEPIKRMSKLTTNLLHALDYEEIKRNRIDNFKFLHAELGNENRLVIKNTCATFMYPLLLPEGEAIRKKMHELKIFVPMLWPDVLNRCNTDTVENDLARNILPLPIDQRYDLEDMNFIVKSIKAFI